MLELKKITKDYAVGDGKVQALKGVDISFRKSEFVSVLGPSGCGKTTLLNIIGGLDHYTSGEMYIDDVSTKNYGDRDWDTYRNHRIGFVFQSYNLIPHQTISQNVELALNISGVDKAERVRRAHEALDKVGLRAIQQKAKSVVGRTVPTRGDCPRARERARNTTCRRTDGRARHRNFGANNGPYSGYFKRTSCYNGYAQSRACRKVFHAHHKIA